MTYARYPLGFTGFRIPAAANNRLFLPGIQPNDAIARPAGVHAARPAVLHHILVEVFDNLVAPVDIIEFHNVRSFNTAAVPTTGDFLTIRPWSEDTWTNASIVIPIHRHFDQGLVVWCRMQVTAAINLMFRPLGESGPVIQRR